MKGRVALAALLTAAVCTAQAPQLTGQLQAAQFLVGTWEGEGWMMTGPEGRQEATVRETITPKAGGTVLTLEGLGKDKKTGTVVHDAFGVLFYDAEKQTFRMRSFVSGRGTGEFPASIKDGVIVWNMTAGPREVRYTIQLDDQKRWHEVGEYKAGDNWVKFFEMTLKKIS